VFLHQVHGVDEIGLGVDMNIAAVRRRFTESVEHIGRIMPTYMQSE